jgi:hypothetical protein
VTRHARGAAVALVALGVLVAGVGPAAADAPGPSDFRSTVTAVDPPSDRVEAEIVGGDSFLELRVDGIEVVVHGYGGEPYLRFLPDGAVERNVLSPATYLNEDRQGAVDLPPEADDEAEPEWEEVASGGSYAWHDHRIHWMGSQPPADVARGHQIKRWEVPLRVDDRPVTVEGVLTYARAVAWWPWVLALLGVGALAWLLGRALRRPIAVATVAAATACSVALVLAGAEQLSVPAEAGRRLLPVLVPAIGAVLGVAAIVLLATGRRRALARNLGLGAVGCAAGWAMLRLAVFTKPVLVTGLAPNLDRAGTAAVLGLALAAAASMVRASEP